MIRPEKIITISALLILVGIAGYLNRPSLERGISTIVKSAQDLKDRHGSVAQGLQEEVFSTPLKDVAGEFTSARLTRSGVISVTNYERLDAGLPVLKENAKLNAAAERKLKDMFDRQYFEHISPDGKGPGYLAEQSGYTYLIVGENLALGNFKNDAALVAAWMASPGHKANILHTRFTEIGIAVGQGEYEGQKIWMAVQEFGLPASECPAVDPHLKASVDAQKTEVDVLNRQIGELRKELDAMPHRTAAEQRAYNEKVDTYNKLVAVYNEAYKDLKTEIDEYNQQVRAFNACLSGK